MISAELAMDLASWQSLAETLPTGPWKIEEEEEDYQILSGQGDYLAFCYASSKMARFVALSFSLAMKWRKLCTPSFSIEELQKENEFGKLAAQCKSLEKENKRMNVSLIKYRHRMKVYSRRVKELKAKLKKQNIFVLCR